MIPSIDWFGKTISVYPLLALAGLLTAGVYACRRAKAQKLDENDMIVFLLAAGLGAVIGMHLLYGLTNYPLLQVLGEHPERIDSPAALLYAGYVIFGGSVFYGGLLGGIAAGFWYVKRKHWDPALWADLAAPVIPLFHFFGRIGCFLGGCCYGVPCSVGFVYQYSPIPQANGVVRFPIQLVGAAGNLILFLVLSRMGKNPRFRGRLLYVYLLSYAPARFFLEFFRGDALRGIWWGLSTSQWISLAVLVCTLLSLVRRLRPAK